MSDKVFVERDGDNLTLLLAAAEKLDMDPSVVRTKTAPFGYEVPQEVADEAGLSDKKAEKKSEPEPQKAPAKKAVSKETGK